jgi:hypothetical protein
MKAISWVNRVALGGILPAFWPASLSACRGDEGPSSQAEPTEAAASIDYALEAGSAGRALGVAVGVL